MTPSNSEWLDSFIDKYCLPQFRVMSADRNIAKAHIKALLDKQVTQALAQQREDIRKQLPEKIEKPPLNTQTISYMKAIELQNATIDQITKILEDIK